MKTLKNILIAAGWLVALNFGLNAQTVTPNTTLCAAQTSSQFTICLQATTNVTNNTGVYVDGEYELVNISNNSTVPAGPAYLPVTRATRAGTIPAAHNSGAVAWLELVPSLTLVPGSSGFSYSTQFGDVGPCVRANQTYLPKIWPDRGVVRDCNGYWVDYNREANHNESTAQLQTISTTGTLALTVATGEYVITKSGVEAMTLAAPTAGLQDGMMIKITSGSANAHTITATSLLETGGSGSPYTTATFAAYPGASLVIMAYQGKWYVISANNVTFS